MKIIITILAYSLIFLLMPSFALSEERGLERLDQDNTKNSNFRGQPSN